MHSFVSSFVSLKVSSISEVFQIFEFYDIFTNFNKYDATNFENIKKECEGYLLLKVSKYNSTNFKLDKLITKEGETYYILAGTYISAYAKNW